MTSRFITPALMAAFLWAAPAYAHNTGYHHTSGAAVQSDKRLLPVTASAFVKAMPDKAVISTAVITEGKNATNTARENAALMNQVYAGLDAIGIARSAISTSQLKLHPKRTYSSNNKSKIVGYAANNTIKVTTNKLDEVGAIMDALITAGVNNIQNVQFSVTDSDALEAKILDEAIRKARAKAQAIATSAGISLGQVHSIDINGTGYTPHNNRFDEIVVTSSGGGGGGGTSYATPISYGEHTINAHVKITYEMR